LAGKFSKFPAHLRTHGTPRGNPNELAKAAAEYDFES
jgi:hypothetical protein